jgi:pSer/pThr/pTyr-binding forkhead associated (FHA) protein
VNIVALSNDETLLVLKLVFLVLLYGFILLVVRSATKDIGGAPQESIILGAAEASRLRAQVPGARAAQFVVLDGPGLRSGSSVEVATTTIVGRGPESGICIDGDDFASAQHARIGTSPEGVWVEDLGSTNGTFVNGARVTSRLVLQAGDIVRVGQTELQLER